MSESAADIVARVAHDYFWAWQERDWDKLRATLAPNVELESPSLGVVRGVDEHVALYQNARRFRSIESVALRRVAHNDDLAFLSYEVYLDYHHKATAIDQLSVVDGLITHVLAVVEEWPPT